MHHVYKKAYLPFKCTFPKIHILKICVCSRWQFCTFFRNDVAFNCLYYQPAKTELNDLLYLNAVHRTNAISTVYWESGFAARLLPSSVPTVILLFLDSPPGLTRRY